jgi:NAD(P)-dependent dehydrogenase (short-subunit alcohol dehydrogenase family)
MSTDTSSPQAARILITGGSRGIGFEIARDLAASGHKLWLAATSDKIHEAARQLGPEHCASRLDVANPQSVAALYSEIRREWQGLEAVIHAAAELGQTGNFWRLDPEAFAHTLRVNTDGSFFVARAFVELWLESSPENPVRRGKIIFFSGGGSGYGYPNFLPYGTSKAAAVRMCETMSMELDAAHVPIDINIVAPGANETSLLAAVRAAGGEVRSVVPFSKPIELCRWLLSASSDGISGRFIHVNDTYSAMAPEGLRAEALKLRRIDL